MEADFAAANQIRPLIFDAVLDEVFPELAFENATSTPDFDKPATLTNLQQIRAKLIHCNKVFLQLVTRFSASLQFEKRNQTSKLLIKRLMINRALKY